MEWAAIRRELNAAIAAASPPPTPFGDGAVVDLASSIKLQLVTRRILSVALQIVEFFDPAAVNKAPPPAITQSGLRTLKPVSRDLYNHDLSEAAYRAVKVAMKDKTRVAQSDGYSSLAPLLVGPLALLTFPAVSPLHLTAALKVLRSDKDFPAPLRRKAPGYYDGPVQSGLQKLLLLGGRIESRVFDIDGVKYVGGLPTGGIADLQAQVVHILQSAGMGLTSALEGTGKSLWLTMESRRSVIEEEQKGRKEGP